MKKFLSVFVFLAIAACGPSPSQIASQAALDTAIAEGKPLFITSFYSLRPNSAGGVDVAMEFVNLSGKTIKYLRHRATPYNAVGDVQRGTVRRRTTFGLNDTGPYAPMERSSGSWENVWYNSTISCVVINRVEIEYMDGTRRIFGSPSEVQSIMAPGLRNSCRV